MSFQSKFDLFDLLVPFGLVLALVGIGGGFWIVLYSSHAAWVTAVVCLIYAAVFVAGIGIAGVHGYVLATVITATVAGLAWVLPSWFSAGLCFLLGGLVFAGVWDEIRGRRRRTSKDRHHISH